MVSLSHYLTLATVLFTIGAIGVVLRRNVLTILMSIELMLNAANLTFVAFSRFPMVSNASQPPLGGHAAAVFVIATAAAEAAVGLAILIAVFRKRQTTHVDELTILRDRAYEPERAAAAPPAAAAHGEAHASAETH